MHPEHYSPFFSGHIGIFKKESGDLPHWTQSDKLQFITFRLSDSLPKTRIDEIKASKAAFEKQYPQPWDETTKRLFNERIGTISERFLNAGYGSCLLQDPAVRKELEAVIRYHDGELYSVFAYVIMPNHVHLLILHHDKSIDEIMQNIKSVSSRKINKILCRQGPVWMRNYFDRIIRSRANLFSTIAYIQSNPHHLPPGTYTLYVNTEALQQFR